ncbi:MAG TPA: metalloregulator ArsR/SmtB family transcription factor [Verrucomicrobiae bacterium]|jgi:DNA-binding transcriptional ArsR family regulator|nr:metalloregulator ArsR/SmtB family transcription factor [Verrucomicrobiae bacterium]
MVEYNLSLDSIFGSLADPTRRDILQRVATRELSVSEIAQPYDLSLAAVSKHLTILERAELVVKRRRGKQHLVQLSPQALASANDYLDVYRQMWEERFNALEDYLSKEE